MRILLCLFALLWGVGSAWSAYSATQDPVAASAARYPQPFFSTAAHLTDARALLVKPEGPHGDQTVIAGITELEEDVEEFSSSPTGYSSGSTSYAALFYALAFEWLSAGHRNALISRHVAFLPPCRRHLLLQVFRI